MAAQGRKRKGSQKEKIIYAVTLAVIAIISFLIGNKTIDLGSIGDIFDGGDKAATSADTTVHFVDVGQGDCTVLISDGEAMLIDAGEKDAAAEVVDYLESLGVKSIKYVVGTHPHSDHIGGLATIIENFEVENIVMPRVPDKLTPTTQTYEQLLETISTKGLKIHAAKDEYVAVGDCRVDFFAPMGEYSDLNDYSVCVKITHGENSFLITGDTEEKAEENLVKRAKNSLDAKVLKLGHHGSSTASSVTLLDAVNPRYAVVSCGSGNKYGHPHEETLERVGKYADHILRTDISGTIVFESDGEGLNVVDSSGKNLLDD